MYFQQSKSVFITDDRLLISTNFSMDSNGRDLRTESGTFAGLWQDVGWRPALLSLKLECMNRKLPQQLSPSVYPATTYAHLFRSRVSNYFGLFLALAAVLLLASCTVVRQGEVGVKRRLGKIDPQYVQQGPKAFNFLTTTIIRVPTRTMNIEVKPALPSKEGLTIRSEISILYRMKQDSAPKFYRITD